MKCPLKNKVAECRAERKMNKSQLARYLGKSRAYITRLERGEIQPRLVVALKMARHFGKQVGEIFQLNDLENKP
jgi:putative transcriptional regulator